MLRELIDLAQNKALEPELVERLQKRLLLADEAYGSGPVQLQCAEAFGTDLQAIPKKNSKAWKHWPIDWTQGRRHIDIIFTQLYDKARAKINSAKRLANLNTRISTKLLLCTIKMFITGHTGRYINQTTHCCLPVI